MKNLGTVISRNSRHLIPSPMCTPDTRPDTLTNLFSNTVRNTSGATLEHLINSGQKIDPTVALRTLSAKPTVSSKGLGESLLITSKRSKLWSLDWASSKTAVSLQFRPSWYLPFHVPVLLSNWILYSKWFDICYHDAYLMTPNKIMSRGGGGEVTSVNEWRSSTFM